MDKKKGERTVGQKIGIMGGTFNPIHVGHLMLAEWAMEAAGLDCVIFMPTGHPYMKDASPVIEGKKRYKMVQLAVQDNPFFIPSSMEIDRKGETYTCDTVEQLKSENPEDTFYFIMGADCLGAIERWKDPDRIFASCHVIAAARNGSSLEEMDHVIRHLQERFGANIRLLQFPAIDISSTDIRERVKNGKSIRYLVPENVREFIDLNGFYQE